MHINKTMIYEFKNTETDEVFEKVMPMAELDDYLKQNPHIKRHHSAAPSVSYSGEAYMGVTARAGDGWKEVQDRIKSGMPPKDRHLIKTK